MPSSLASAVEGLFDYAGLFPPAKLGLAEALAEYQELGGCPLLGSFACPWASLSNVAEEWRGEEPLPVALIVAGLPDGPLALPEHVLIETVEVRWESEGAMREAVRRWGHLQTAGHPAEVFVEVPLDERMSDALEAIATTGLNAKVRLGGMTVTAFPDPKEVAAFIVEAVDLRLAFKLTAGLHHPITGSYPISQAEPDLGKAPMMGFLNCIVAVGAAEFFEASGRQVERILVSGAEAFQWTDDGVEFEGERLATAQLIETRDILRSIGSCSLREPMDDLRTMGLWP